MIDFIYKLNETLPHWPPATSWTLKQIAEATETSVPHVVQYLEQGLGKEIESSTMIVVDEAAQAIDFLAHKYRPQIEARERELAEAQAKAVEKFDRIMEKIRMLQFSKEWYSSYRTLCYFIGQEEEHLPIELALTVCSDIVRLGIKANANIQELGRWLQKGVQISLSMGSRTGIEEALDLIDAYGEYFLEEESGKGALLLGTILAVLEEPAAHFELWEEYKELVNQLYPLT